jgi:hypothetical protein
MKRLILIFVTGLILLNYRQTIGQTKKEENKIEFNQGLADELKAMAEIDQIAAYIRQGNIKIGQLRGGTTLKTVYLRLTKKDWRKYLINSDTLDIV